MRLRLFTGRNGRGEPVDITADMADLNELRRRQPGKNWNDLATSLRVEWVGKPPGSEPATEDDANGPR